MIHLKFILTHNLLSDLNLFNQPVFIQGSDYDPKLDGKRLAGQMLKVFEYMRNGKYRTLYEIRSAINEPEASVSAQLRHLRKDRNGGHDIQKKRREEPKNGLWEYKLIVNHSGNGYIP